MMTDALPAADRQSFASRLSPGTRLAAFSIAGLLFLFSSGLLVGVAMRTIEEQSLPSPRGLTIAGIALLVAAVSGASAWITSAHWRRPDQSNYQRRYARMWVVIIATGLILGLLIGLSNGAASGVELLFTNEPLSAPAAIGISASLATLLVVTLVVYHRAVDDHEQQAYLWANSIAFYFLTIAMPVAWLLARGGIIPAIGSGTMMLILLAALHINLAMWAWLKFR